MYSISCTLVSQITFCSKQNFTVNQRRDILKWAKSVGMKKMRKVSFGNVWSASLIRSSVYRFMLQWGVTSSMSLSHAHTCTHTHSTIPYLLIHTHIYGPHICVLFTNPLEIKLCSRTTSERCTDRQTQVLRVWLLEQEFCQLRHESYLHILLSSTALRWPQPCSPLVRTGLQLSMLHRIW